MCIKDMGILCGFPQVFGKHGMGLGIEIQSPRSGVTRVGVTRGGN